MDVSRTRPSRTAAESRLFAQRDPEAAHHVLEALAAVVRTEGPERFELELAPAYQEEHRPLGEVRENVQQAETDRAEEPATG